MTQQIPASDWAPITEAALWDRINAAEARMSVRQSRLWELVRILPVIWPQEPWGRHGFRVIGLIGSQAIWFNDLEDGFVRTAYTLPGTITGYASNQDSLEECLQKLLAELDTGWPTTGVSGGPAPGEYRP